MKKTSVTPAAYADVAVLARSVGEELMARLDVVALQPRAILEVGCRVGFCTQLLRARYPQADICALDASPDMLAFARESLSAEGALLNAMSASAPYWVMGAERSLPFKSATFDLIVANMIFAAAEDMKTLLVEWRRYLRPEGLLIFTCLGPDTLKELRHAAPHLPMFADMHTVGDELLQAGFVDPIVDVEEFTLKYRQWEQLIAELHITGMGEFAADAEEKPLALTYEVIYGHAWAGMPSAGFTADEKGEVRIPLSHLRR